MFLIILNKFQIIKYGQQKKKLYEYIDEFRTTFKPIYKVNGLYFCL